MAFGSSSGDVDFSIDVDVVQSLAADMDATVEDLAQAAMAAADSVEAWGKGQLRADTRGPLGDKVANAWRSKVWPNRSGQASLSPSIGWWSNAPHIIQAFSEGLTIRSGQGLWLIIPTENAPQTGKTFGERGRLKRGRGHALTEAERRFGRLRFVPVKGRQLGLLVADKVRARTGQRRHNAHTRYTAASPTAIKRGNYEDGVVMFIMVPAATMPKSIDPQAIADAIGREGLARFARAFQDITQRRFGPAE